MSHRGKFLKLRKPKVGTAFGYIKGKKVGKAGNGLDPKDCERQIIPPRQHQSRSELTFIDTPALHTSYEHNFDQGRPPQRGLCCVKE